ncbi:peptidoglycan-binding protein [Rhodobacteraceae bacterium RKSG542]|uniref:peptidoglycan-binding domain-containing protein n=1 Tax=Pseudovibrio flavus TaxID=2529854 RepID=UPI0012BCCD75|nr:peptidoglycan-binding protein [Pseudovibrio flavus]MTI17075.1 peptidoglycan-binding protein [Pseudovibrio flavus]
MARRKSAGTYEETYEDDTYEDVGEFVAYTPERERGKVSRSFKTTVAILMLLTAGLIAGNAVLFQEGVHPSPLVATRQMPEKVDVKKIAASIADPVQVALVRDVQRELRRLELYEGSIDGLEGPATQRAVRAYERSRQLSETGLVTAALLAKLTMDSNIDFSQGDDVPLPRTAPSSSATNIQATKVSLTSSQPAAPAKPASDPKVLEVQKVLAKLGYGPLSLDGISGGQTTSAVKRFQADNGMTVTGAISPTLVSRLEQMIGRRI